MSLRRETQDRGIVVAEAEGPWAAGRLSPAVYVPDTAGAVVSVSHSLVAAGEKSLPALVCMSCGAPGGSEPGAHETQSDGLVASALEPAEVWSCWGSGRERSSLAQGM